MKSKRYIVLSVLCAVYCCLYAQPRLKTPEFQAGVHGGVSASTVLFNPAMENMRPITNGVSIGGNGGLVFRYARHKYCAFQVELNYEHRGWATGNGTIGHTYRHLHYVEVPIFMHLNFGSEVCRWFFNLGPQIGYCVYDETHSIEHPFDWGLAAGTGLYVRTRHAGLYQLEFRFDFSFGGIYGTRVEDYYSAANPMDLSVRLGWLWPTKVKVKGER